MPLIPKFLKRKNSGRRGRREEAPVVAPSPLSPVSEHSIIHVPASDAGSPRPVPPPPLARHVDDIDFERGSMRSMGNDDFRDDMDDPDPHSRLYETFSRSTSQNGHTDTVPMVIREDDRMGMEHLDPVPGAYSEAPSLQRQRSFDDHPGVLHSEHPEEIGYVGTERSGSARPVYIAPSNLSASSHGSQKVTFLGNMPSHDRATPSLHRKALSTSSRGMPSRDRRRAPLAPSTMRDEYRPSRRHASETAYPPPPRMSRPEYRYAFRRPYLIFTDFGEGLEVGNEEDGFMRYEDYRDTAHLRSNRDDTYYIIPGSTPVMFHDENGNELYRVDGWKYNTPTLRRKQYIIEDDNGRELFRVGGSDGSRHSSDGYSSPSSNLPKVQYLNSEFGRQAMHHRLNLKYKNKRPPARSYRDYQRHRVHHQQGYTRSPSGLTRSALFEARDDDDEKTVSSKISSNPDIIVVNEVGEQIYDSRNSFTGAQSPRTRSHYITEVSYPSRPESGFVGEHGRTVERSPRSPALRWGNSSTETDESHEGSHRHSRVFRA